MLKPIWTQRDEVEKCRAVRIVQLNVGLSVKSGKLFVLSKSSVNNGVFCFLDILFLC